MVHCPSSLFISFVVFFSPSFPPFQEDAMLDPDDAESRAVRGEMATRSELGRRKTALESFLDAESWQKWTGGWLVGVEFLPDLLGGLAGSPFVFFDCFLFKTYFVVCLVGGLGWVATSCLLYIIWSSFFLWRIRKQLIYKKNVPWNIFILVIPLMAANSILLDVEKIGACQSPDLYEGTFINLNYPLFQCLGKTQRENR